MSHMFRRSHSGAAGIGAGILGLAAGAAIAYFLYGTEAGEEKRRMFGRYARKMKERAVDAKDTIVEYADKKDDVVELAGRMKDHLKEMKEDIEDTLG